MRQRLVFVLSAFATIGLAMWCLMPDTVVARNGDIDEGVYLMVARLIHRGYDTSTFFFDQFWLFPKIIATAFKFFGDSLMVGRLTVFAFSLAGLIGTAVLCYQLGAGWIAAMVAMLFGAINPLYIRQSRMVMADIPATTCAVWALVFVFLFQKSRRRIFLALSGVFASASLTLKPFAIGFAVTIIIVLLTHRMQRENGRRHLDWWQLGGDLLVFVTAGIVIAMPFIDFLHPIDEYQRTVGFHFAERNWLTTRVDDRWRALLTVSRLNVPLLVFAISGMAALRPLSMWMMALLGGELVTTAILLQMPPWLHHYTLIVPPLIVFSAVGFDRGMGVFKRAVAELRDRRRPSSSTKAVALLFASAILITLIDVPWLIRYDRRERCPQPLRLDAVVHYIQENSRPNEYLLADDALVLYLADRLMPPSAIDFTYGDVIRFDPGSLARLQQVVRDNNVTGILVSARYERNRRLMSWIEMNFPTPARLGNEDADELKARFYTANK
jgi:hypothetical protein